jgi:putative ABC transport system substrate-binding protein
LARARKAISREASVVTATIGRRSFVTALGGAAASSLLQPFARAQQPATPIIGLLQIGAASSYDLSGFRQGLKEAGFIEGQNLAIKYDFANDDPNRLPELAVDLVRGRVRVIVSLASVAAVQAAMAATSTIPIVFGNGGDPVQRGVVASLNRPGGNVTGMTSMSAELVGKQLGILHELLPQAARFGVLSNPKNPIHEFIVRDAKAAATAIGATIEILPASNGAEIDAGLAPLVDERHVEGLLVSNDPVFIAQRVQLAVAAARYRLPAIYPFREQAKAGGLMSYGPDLAVRDREVGHYVGRILNGESPAELPVQQSAKFEFIVNLNTAKALGLTFPPGRLATADEVIE